jgi:hypothetical protein
MTVRRASKAGRRADALTGRRIETVPARNSAVFSVDVTLRPGTVSYVEVAPRVGNITATAVGGLIDAAASENGKTGPFSVALLDQAAGAFMLGIEAKAPGNRPGAL